MRIPSLRLFRETQQKRCIILTGDMDGSNRYSSADFRLRHFVISNSKLFAEGGLFGTIAIQASYEVPVSIVIVAARLMPALSRSDDPYLLQ